MMSVGQVFRCPTFPRSQASDHRSHGLRGNDTVGFKTEIPGARAAPSDIRGDVRYISESAQIFISYAHADNQSFDAEARGWTAEFIDKLEKAAHMKPGGSGANCWIDYRLEPQRKVDEALRGQIQKSRCILAFMSPCYLESE